MPILLAYAFDEPRPVDEIAQRVGRIERHYQRCFAPPLVQSGWIDPLVGLASWEVEDAPCRWPHWVQNEHFAAASTYVPFGWQRLTGELPFEQAALTLARKLMKDCSLLEHIDPPFVQAVYDRREGVLTLMNDGLGMGRLYEMEFPGGCVWSNRLGALPLFAGVAPEINLEGWRYLAAVGWFMDDSTSIHGARQVGPGTVICANVATRRRTTRPTQVIDRWVRPRGSRGVTEAAVEAVREHLVDIARSLPGLWPQRPVVHLSGGRDSRAMAAAVITGGVDAAFATRNFLAGEVTVVNMLLERLATKIDHEVIEQSERNKLWLDEDDELGSAHALRARVIDHHLRIDGMSSPNALNAVSPLPERAATAAHLTGAGGELAHGHYYPRAERTFWQTIAARMRRLVSGMPPLELIQAVERKILRHRGGLPETLRQARDRIGGVLEEGAARGLAGLNLLDYFYLVERLRRWSNSSTHLERVSPMVNAAFIRAAFDLQPADRFANAFHKALIARMIPTWRDVPFYSTSEEDQRNYGRVRLWDSKDAAEYEEIILRDDRWHDVFDAEEVRGMWREARAGRGQGRYEVVFRRVAWRAGFDDHLQRLAQTVKAPAEPPVLAS